ncbi:MAG: nucleoside deaminase [bacterium]
MNNNHMQQALAQAQLAFAQDEVPIGAVVVRENNIITQAFNSCETDRNPLSHAEIKAIQEATKKTGNWRLTDCDLYVTLEPCPMCLGALFQARIRTLYIGCYDHKRLDNNLSIFPSLKGKTQITDNNHTIKVVGGIMETECSELLKDFFKKKR